VVAGAEVKAAVRKNIGEGMLLFIRSALENADPLPRHADDVDTLDILLDSVEADLEALLSVARTATKYGYRNVGAIEKLLRHVRGKRYDVISPELVRARAEEASGLRENVFAGLLPLRKKVKEWMGES